MSVEETRRVVRAYHEAYRRGQVGDAVAQLGEPFRFKSPMMAFDAIRQHAAALERFVPLITDIAMISELYGDGEATLIYNLHTSLPIGVQSNAEHFRVRDGRIVEILIIFDATPWHPIIEAAARIRGPLEVAPPEDA